MIINGGASFRWSFGPHNDPHNFRMQQYIVNDHPYHAPQIIGREFMIIYRSSARKGRLCESFQSRTHYISWFGLRTNIFQHCGSQGEWISWYLAGFQFRWLNIDFSLMHSTTVTIKNQNLPSNLVWTTKSSSFPPIKYYIRLLNLEKNT